MFVLFYFIGLLIYTVHNFLNNYEDYFKTNFLMSIYKITLLYEKHNIIFKTISSFKYKFLTLKICCKLIKYLIDI